MIALLKEAWVDVAARKDIAAAQFAGNLVLLALLYWWLGLAVSSGARVALIAVVAAALIAGSAWLQGAGLAAFRPTETGHAFTLALRRLVTLSAITILFVVAFLAWDYALGQRARMDNWVASALTFSSQKPVKAESIAWMFTWKLRAYFVLIGLGLTPIAAASVGAIESAVQVLRQPKYWLAGILLAILGLYLPFLLIDWIPATNSLPLELASAIARFTAAYALAIASWLTLAALVARLGRALPANE